VLEKYAPGQDFTAKTVPLLKLFQKREKVAIAGIKVGDVKMVKIFNIEKKAPGGRRDLHMPFNFTPISPIN
jgi:hypothetical protein